MVALWWEVWDGAVSEMEEGMTEDQIERRVESMFDALDYVYMHTPSMTKAEYEAAHREIDAWATRQYVMARES